MRRVRTWLLRFGGVFSAGRRYRELSEELESHLQLHIDDNLRSGMSPGEARRHALIRLGGVEPVKENYRYRRSVPSIETILQDLRYGMRILLRDPGFTAVAVLALALGIGANSTIFSWIDSTLLNPIPGLARTSELAALTNGGTADDPVPFSYPDYVDLRDGNQTLSGLMAFGTHHMNLTGAGKPELIWGTVASTNYFDVLGVRPIRGRGFLPIEEQKPGGAPVAVISYRLWQTHFGADESVIGRTIYINRHPYTIIGITPRAFQGCATGLRSDLWIPLTMEQQVIPGQGLLDRRDAVWLMSLGRLRGGVSRLQAQREMNVLMARLVLQYPEFHKGANEVTLYPLWRGPYGANAYLYFFLPMLMSLAGVVLLLACANVANLLLVRSVARQRELAIRLSLGASRARLVRQLLVESLLLSLAGGGLAMLLTSWSAGTLTKFIPPAELPISLQPQANGTVLLATLAISIITGLIFGSLPALRSSSLTPAAVLKEDAVRASGGIRKVRLASGLVVAQISLSLLLLICAGLFVRAFRNAQRFYPGFNPDHVLLSSFDLFPAGYSEATGKEFYRQLLTRLEALPGVQSVSLADWAPLGFSSSSTTIQPEGYVPQARESMAVACASTSPNYLRTMQISLEAGRDFEPRDTDKSQAVAVVNRALADRYWPHQDVVGKRLRANGRWLSIIGVARNSDYSDLNETPKPFLYLPLSQDYSPFAIVHARGAGDPLALASAVEMTVHALNSDLPVFDVTPLQSRLQMASSGERIAGTLAGAFGLVALILAAVGIYGVIAYTTRQRTHEIGIRMALGAGRGNIARLVLGQALGLTLTGLAIGLGMSWGVTRFLASMLFGVTATDPLTFASVAGLLCVVAMGSCYLPVRRALRGDPMGALRYE